MDKSYKNYEKYQNDKRRFKTKMAKSKETTEAGYINKNNQLNHGRSEKEGNAQNAKEESKWMICLKWVNTCRKYMYEMGKNVI